MKPRNYKNTARSLDLLYLHPLYAHDTGKLMIFFIALILGFIPATIAALKGRRFFVWWIYGALIFIIALPHSLFASILKRCPQCKESAQRDANICPHCRTAFTHHLAPAAIQSSNKATRYSSSNWEK
ncbi:zinc ribbon domain-containing protein [Pseudomonas sp. 8Z]|uniref:zinc ribbon domain-containing protein n=1 Tax=Pseudomonas sp. 8Z TaxID=2653166 RepID=UPI001C499F7F|nr:zinc ribbon domain-containing protein [Pseudomonas sp. 8Z]